MENSIFSEIKIVTLPRFRVARYVIISPNPEQDVFSYMEQWAQTSGLLDVPGYQPRAIGWDFPFVTEEQQKRFGLRGYVAAYVIPDDFVPKCCGAELADIAEDTYATLTITDPHADSFSRIPEGYQKLFDFINSGEYKTLSWENRILFEEEYDKGGVHYMDLYIPVK